MRRAEQLALAKSDNVKLRLGRINIYAQQPGVDALIITELIELARNHVIADAILLCGERDMRAGDSIAQAFAVRVHLLGIDRVGKTNLSSGLSQEADNVKCRTAADVGSLLTLINAQSDVFANRLGIAAGRSAERSGGHSDFLRSSLHLTGGSSNGKPIGLDFGGNPPWRGEARVENQNFRSYALHLGRVIKQMRVGRKFLVQHRIVPRILVVQVNATQGNSFCFVRHPAPVECGLSCCFLMTRIGLSLNNVSVRIAPRCSLQSKIIRRLRSKFRKSHNVGGSFELYIRELGASASRYLGSN